MARIGISNCRTTKTLVFEKNLFLTLDEECRLRFFHPRRQLSFLLGRKAYFLTRSSLGFSPKRDDLQIHYGLFGYPFISHPNFDLSLSHAGNCGVSAVFPRELLVGIDIEYTDEKRQKMFSEQIKELEGAIFDLESYTFSQRSLAFWTIKESISKALRCGLSVPPFFLEMENITDYNDFLHSTFKYFPQFQCLTWVSNIFAFSVAFPKNVEINKSQKFYTQIKAFLLRLDEVLKL